MNKILPPEPTLTVFPYHASFEYDGTIYYPAGITYRGAKLPPIVKGEADRFEVPRQFFRYHRDRLRSLYETAFADIEIAGDGLPIVRFWDSLTNTIPCVPDESFTPNQILKVEVVQRCTLGGMNFSPGDRFYTEFRSIAEVGYCLEGQSTALRFWLFVILLQGDLPKDPYTGAPSLPRTGA